MRANHGDELAAAVLFAAPARAAETPAASSIDVQALRRAWIERSISCRTRPRPPDGSYAAVNGPGVTAVVTAALCGMAAQRTTRWWPRA